MLSDAEQRTLIEIETGLESEDPAFVLQFGDTGRRSRQPARRGAIVRGWMTVAAFALAFAWLLESALLVVVGLSAISVGATWWAVRVEIDGRAPRDDTMS